jgi:hypothetical protein
MLIAHHRHGEVYVPTIEKKFFGSTIESKKILAPGPGIFSWARADTHEKAIDPALARHERALNST